ncbi:hypothetical protein EJD97_014793 [Solanum chilense]|uniref:Large ribosomal subunit protein uL11 C-terminal domain-containing protein n=1 Tax=Solanum chilense TaxID=4083 RepID=A0A6N2AF75_SOLCI|nr:hypothetical protein EJD97_014793 [Solanum chilense]
MELSHRGKEFISIIQKVESDLRTFLISLMIVPSAAALVIKALKEPEHDRKKTNNIKHNGDISLDVVIEIAKILGTYVSVGCTVDGKDTKELQQDIIDGDVEIPQD